ncbi:MAG: E3 ubiquitin ligase family protein [Sandaracinaceae bacterium]|nr:E3 ubiquitin ligase family protein [Sandaracinaceae bacterium]
MLGIGVLVLFIGGLALIGGIVQRVRSGRLASTAFAKTGDVASKGSAVAGDKGAISTEGRVVANGMVTAPVTGTDCLFYETIVTATWKVGDASFTERVTDERLAAQFGVDDGSGTVWVDASKGGDFDTKQVFKKKDSRGLMSALTGKPLTFGDRGFSVPQGLRVNGKLIPDSAEFEVTERCLMPAEHFYVNGKLDAQNRIGSPSWTALILSTKKREELMASTAQWSKYLLMGGGATSAAGAVVAAVGAMMG